MNNVAHGIDDLRDATGARQSKGMTRTLCDHRRRGEPSSDPVSHLGSVRHTTVSMANPPNRIEVVTSVQRRRRWTASEKVRMVEETFAPGMTVGLVAGQHGVAPNQLFTWRVTFARSSDRKTGAFLNAILKLKRCTQAI